MGLLEYVIPGYQAGSVTLKMLDLIDTRTASGLPVSEFQILAALYCEEFCQEVGDNSDLNVGEVQSRAGRLLTPHCAHFHIAHGIRHQAAELLVGCYRLRRGPGRRGYQRFLRHPSFPAILRFYELMCEAGAGDPELLVEWRKSNQGDPREMTRKRQRPRRRKPRQSKTSPG